MLKKLHKQMLFIVMGLLSLVMAATLSTVYIVARQNIFNSIDKRIEEASAYSLTETNGRLVIEETPSLSDYSSYFTLTINDYGVLVGITSDFNIAFDFYSNAFEQIWAFRRPTKTDLPKGVIELSNRTWCYSTTIIERDFSDRDEGVS